MILSFIRLSNHLGHALDTPAELHTKALVSGASLVPINDGVTEGVGDRTGKILW